MIAALSKRKLIAPFTVEGVCDRTVFEAVRDCLVLVLALRQVVIMDNATFRKGGRIEQLIGGRRSTFVLTFLLPRPQQNRKLLVLAQEPHPQTTGSV